MGCIFSSIDEIERGRLEREEVIDVVNGMKGTRFWGLMDLQWHSFNNIGISWRKMFWHSLRRYFLIVALRSKTWSTEFKRFLPISLVGSLYKILAKCWLTD